MTNPPEREWADPLLNALATVIHQSICCTAWRAEGHMYYGCYIPETTLNLDPGHTGIDRIRANQVLQGLTRSGYQITTAMDPDGNIT